MRNIGWASAVLAFAAMLRCTDHSSNDSAAQPGAERETGTDGGLGGVEAPGAGEELEPELPPEVELEDDFRVPVTTGRFVWTANPSSNRVTLIDSETFGLATLDAGFGPTYLAGVPTSTDERSGAIVINAASIDATLFLAKDTSDVLVSEPVPIHAGANAWSVSPSGRWAIAWTNAARLTAIDATEGLQDISVIDLDGYPEEMPSVTRLSVGYRPSSIVFNASEERAFVVAEPGISVVELVGSDTPRVSRDLGVSAAPAAEVAITPDGQLALVRQFNSSEVNIVDLNTAERKVVQLPGVVTDLDLSPDASFAVAIVRGVSSAGPENAEPGAAGHAGVLGVGGQGGDSGMGMAGAGGDVGGEPGLTNSSVAILPIPGIVVATESFTTMSVPQLVGSVVVPPVGDNVLLFTNAVVSDYVTILNTSTNAWREVDLKAPVRALFPSGDGAHAVALLAPPQASSKAGAFSLIPVSRRLPPKLQGTEAPALGVAVSAQNAIITTRDPSTGVHEAYLAGFPSLRVDAIELPSVPTASGLVVDTNLGYIAQEHAEGRITFVDLNDASARTLTGFELGLKVTDDE